LDDRLTTLESAIEMEKEQEHCNSTSRQSRAAPPLPLAELSRMQAEASKVLAARAGVSLPNWPLLAPQAPQQTLAPELGVEIPVGPLFYPCCGGDTGDALSVFGGHVTVCHFADPYDPPQMPRRRRNDPRAPVCVKVPFVGNVLIGERRSKTWVSGQAHGASHRADGFLTRLETIGPLAVFYYRGDSGGEGGSGQMWLMPVLFDFVVSQMLVGGLICTDGSNGAGHHAGECGPGAEILSLPANPSVGATFPYRTRVLRCVALLSGERRRTMAAWQVT